MFARIARQYRRFLLGSALLTLIVALGLLLGLADWPADMSNPLLVTLSWLILLVLVVGIPVALFALLLPGLLPLIEIWGIALLLLGLLDPAIRFVIAQAALPGWSWCIALFAVFICVERALYGPWLLDFRRRDMPERTATLVIPGTPDAIWRALAPDPEHPQNFYWPGASFLAPPRGSHADVVLNLPRQGGYKDALLKIHLERADPPARLRYRAEPMPGSADPAHHVAIDIAPIDGGKCRVIYTLQYLDVPLGRRLFYYLNHDFRDTLASLRARLSGRPDRSIQGLQMLKSSP
ncbi:SRPBCC family protein [Roseovarius sp. CAU 1744]|uniref:SRPBCC family protein n=1 Tax=Roseovarius sp. CAU 1744 TaxID=3140368 RepID=UPI00325AD935